MHLVVTDECLQWGTSIAGGVDQLPVRCGNRKRLKTALLNSSMLHKFLILEFIYCIWLLFSKKGVASSGFLLNCLLSVFYRNMK